ncbi:MAG: alpha/beta hydrolase [Planctomycetaceae bacterium]|jgi:acetyl esterase/lipase|nr:alpha/beta hydrolase [Planctomycetaceae bacterium]
MKRLFFTITVLFTVISVPLLTSWTPVFAADSRPNFSYKICKNSGGETIFSVLTGLISPVNFIADQSVTPEPAEQTVQKKIEPKQTEQNKPTQKTVPVKQTEQDSFIVLENIPYIKNGGIHQQLDLYLPKNYQTATQPFPLIIVIHGGGWIGGSKDSAKFVEWSRFLAENGYAVAAINYRLRPKFLLPTQIIDSKSAVRWLRANAKRYNLDAEHFGAIGSSAGGHLASSLGTSAHVKEFDQGENLDQSGTVQAVVDFCGPSDFLTFRADEKSAKGLFGENAGNQDIIEKTSPLHTVTKNAAPFLIVHAIDDERVPMEQGKRLHESLQKSGVESDFIELSSGGHGSPLFKSPETKKRILDFFGKHLKK